jgi:hypothetical protein
MLRRTRFIVPTFNKNTLNKIGNSINVSGKNTLVSTEEVFRVAIAEESIDANVDGKHLFCALFDNVGTDLVMMFGFTLMETFDSTNSAHFGSKGLTGAGMDSLSGNLCYPVHKNHNIIHDKISQNAKEIISILTISNNGKKKEIRFLVDGKESKSSDVSEYLNGDLLFPAICPYDANQQVTTIPIDQIKKRTPEIENLIKEYQEQQKETEALTSVRPVAVVPSIASEPNNADQIISQLRQRIDEERQKQIGNLEEQLKQTRNDFLKQHEEMRKDFLKQLDTKARENEDMRKDFQRECEKKDSQIEEMRKDFLKQNEEMRKDFLKQLSDSQKNLLQHFESERQILRTQLDLERAEHQKTRNLLSLKK